MNLERGFKVIFLGLLCSPFLPIANANEYVIDAENDPIILKLAIALLILSIVFLVCVIVVLLFVYKTIKDTAGIERNYQVSYRESESNGNRANPFDGHAMYSRRTATIYLPGRETSTNNLANIYTEQPTQRENKGFVYEESRVIRDSPPVEKGQEDSMVSEKTTRRRPQELPSFENDYYAASNSGFYELSIGKTFKEQ